MAASRTSSCRPLLDCDGIDVAASHVEHDSREGPTRRPGGRRARPQIEPALVAGTIEAALCRSGDYGTGEVRTLLVEGDEFGRGQPHQQARLMLVRVGEAER